MTKKMTTLLLLICAAIIYAQGYTPIRGIGIQANAVNNNGICLGCYNGSLNAVIDADLNNKVSLGNLATLVSGNGISVKNTNTTYPAGYVTGFNVDLGTSYITAALLSSMTISTYKAGVLQESSTTSTLLSVPAFGGQKNRVFLHFITSKSFDEVRLYQTNGLALFGAMNLYYAFAFDPKAMPVDNNGICDDIIAGPGVDGNVSGSSSFIAPLSYVSDKDKISNGNKNDYGSIIMPAGLLGSYSIGLLDKNTIYPAGNRAGFVISPDDEGKLLSAEFLKNITIETYLFGKLQDSKTLSDGGGFINIKVLGFGSGKQKVSLTTTKPFNEIRLKVTQTLGFNFGTLKVYYAFEEPLTCECDDKIQTSGSAVSGSVMSPGLFGNSWTSGTGLFGLVLAKMVNTESITDSYTSNYATATIPAASLLSIFSAYATVQTNALQPANTFAGFTIDKSANLFGVSVLESITISLFNNNVPTETFAGTGSLISGNFFTTDSNKFYVGGKATKPFNRIKITFYSGTGIRFPQTYNIYNAFASKDADGDGVPDCFDLCLGGNDAIDTNGNGVPDCAESCSAVNDKDPILDADNDGISDMCDEDADNDGIPDSLEEDSNRNGIYQDDDSEGFGYLEIAGDGIANYRDLDSDNDGILDLFESGIPVSVINQIDVDKNGVIDEGIAVGRNGIADILETSPDSGVLKYPIKDTNGDGRPDFLDNKSNGVDYDLYVIGKANLDTTGFGLITIINDSDYDGIQAVVDTDLIYRGAPGSPMSPYAVTKSNKLVNVIESASDVKIAPNPVKAGVSIKVLGLNSELKSNYRVYNAQGQVVKTGSISGNAEIATGNLTSGIYIIQIDNANTVKSYKVIVE